MIKKIKLENFQAHKNLKIKCGKITTIVGSSDVGKSAVIRAIRWVVQNKPLGTSYIKKGKNEAKVEIQLEGKTVTRTRSKSENKYSVDNQVFQAFGNEPPDVVSGLFNMNDLNFQKQHDKIFWLSETPGEVSRQLNQIINLSIIDTTLANIARTLRNSKAEEKVLEQRFNESKAKVKKLKGVLKQDEALAGLEKLNDEFQTLNMGSYTLDAHIKQIESLTQEAHQKGEQLKSLKKVLQLSTAFFSVKSQGEQVYAIIQRGQQLKQILNRPTIDTSPLENSLEHWQGLSNKTKSLENLIEEGVSLQEQIETAKGSIKQCQKTLKEEMGKECPLCGSAL